MTDRGWEADCLVSPDEAVGRTVERYLASAHYTDVVIEAGIRLPVHRAAPDAAIAFNTMPEDSAEAAARWLLPG